MSRTYISSTTHVKPPVAIPKIQMELASARVERLRQKAQEDDHLHQNGDAVSVALS